MTADVLPFRRDPARCRCEKCLRAARRFPDDPPQLLLPFAPDELPRFYGSTPVWLRG